MTRKYRLYCFADACRFNRTHQVLSTQLPDVLLSIVAEYTLDLSLTNGWNDIALNEFVAGSFEECINQTNIKSTKQHSKKIVSWELEPILTAEIIAMEKERQEMENEIQLEKEKIITKEQRRVQRKINQQQNKPNAASHQFRYHRSASQRNNSYR